MNRRSWHDYFLSIAKEVSMRSTCIRRAYGAVIVKDNVIVSTGYNGSPRGDVNCCDIEECERNKLNIPKGERYELSKAVHAEANAIINCDPVRMKGAIIYIYGWNCEDKTLACGDPCLMCERMIRNAQINKVITYTRHSKILKITKLE